MRLGRCVKSGKNFVEKHHLNKTSSGVINLFNGNATSHFHEIFKGRQKQFSLYRLFVKVKHSILCLWFLLCLYITTLALCLFQCLLQEKKAREFHANPMPNFRSQQYKSGSISMQPTQAEPFNFKTDERIEKRFEKETCKVSLKCVY